MTNQFVVANWKMNLTAAEASALTQEILPSCSNLSRAQVWLAPSDTSIPSVSQIIRGSPIQVGAQNICGEPKGAFTGEVSATMLKEFGCTFAITGHSERRHVFGESDLATAKRAAGCLQQGLTPIFCIGELLEERQREQTEEVLYRQLSALMKILEPQEFENIMIAYEPCWAIGTGHVATLEIIEEVHSFIFSTLKTEMTAPKAILYGGSVTPENFGPILKVKHVDGGLVGGASLKAESIIQLIRIADA